MGQDYVIVQNEGTHSSKEQYSGQTVKGFNRHFQFPLDYGDILQEKMEMSSVLFRFIVY